MGHSNLNSRLIFARGVITSVRLATADPVEQESDNYSGTQTQVATSEHARLLIQRRK